MSRRRGHYGDEFKYLDKIVRIHPETGKFYVPDYDFQGDTLDQVKAEIKAHQVKREKAPRFPVWFRDSSWVYHGRGEWMQGETSGHLTGRMNNEIVVTYKNSHGELSRKNLSISSVYPVSEKNDNLIGQVVALDEQIKKLEENRSKLENQLDNVTPLEDE